MDDDVNVDLLFEPFDMELYKCQWRNCTESFNDFGYYFGHVCRCHANDYVNAGTVCGWRGCCQDGFDTVNRLYTHITVHVYYYRIMSDGYRVLKEFGFDKAMCHLDSSYRCDISAFPTKEFVCAWKDCNGTFSDYNLFVQHTGFHAIEDVTIPLVAKEKLRKIRFAQCEWLNCAKNFKTKTHLKAHLLSHSFGKSHACPVCGLGFVNKAQFLNHCHRQETSVSVPEMSRRSSKVIGKKRGRDKIETAAVDKDEDDGEDREKIEDPDKDDKKRDKDSDKKEESDALQCSSCPKTFISQQLLTQHLARHLRKYACDQCDYIAPYPSNLKAHIKYKHSNERNYGCKFCHAKFKTNNDLVRHVQLHSNPPPDNVCRICLKCYTTQYSLKRHMAEHEMALTTMKFQCEVCAEKFEELETITEHLRREHSSG